MHNFILTCIQILVIYEDIISKRAMAMYTVMYSCVFQRRNLKDSLWHNICPADSPMNKQWNLLHSNKCILTTIKLFYCHSSHREETQFCNTEVGTDIGKRKKQQQPTGKREAGSSLWVLEIAPVSFLFVFFALCLPISSPFPLPLPISHSLILNSLSFWIFTLPTPLSALT